MVPDADQIVRGQTVVSVDDGKPVGSLGDKAFANLSKPVSVVEPDPGETRFSKHTVVTNENQQIIETTGRSDKITQSANNEPFDSHNKKQGFQESTWVPETKSIEPKTVERVVEKVLIPFNPEVPRQPEIHPQTIPLAPERSSGRNPAHPRLAPSAVPEITAEPASQANATAERTVYITIGRIEIRAAGKPTSQKSVPAAERRSSVMSLNDYIAQCACREDRMSNQLAIAACTATLRSVLQTALNEAETNVEVTTLPLDRASQDNPVSRINLFLYDLIPNAGWRNQPFPDRGPNSPVPLPLNLYYLLTAYGDDQNSQVGEETDQKLLGWAMTSLHELVLSKKQILDATRAIGSTTDSRFDLNQSDLHQQIENIRITFQPMTYDDKIKLWGTFQQVAYRTSAAYQASVVLLETPRKQSSPFPVLGRNDEADIGPNVDSGLRPRLESIVYRDARTLQRGLSAARVGDIFTVTGSDLPVRNCRIVLFDPKARPTESDPNAPRIAELTPLDGSSESQLLASLEPTDKLVAGTLALAIETGVDSDSPKLSSGLPFYLSPRLTSDDSPDSPLNVIVTFVGGSRKLIVISRPSIDPKRETWLLLTPTNDQPPPEPIRPDPVIDNASDDLVFDAQNIPPGTYRIRLRVESPKTESLPIRRVGDEFVRDDRQEVRL